MIHFLSKLIPFRYRFISVLFLLINVISVSAQQTYLCVWRNPERTMSIIFPNAKDYKTINHALTADEVTRIEKTLGFSLLPGQREQFQYFILHDKQNNTIGYIMAASQKGEFGAIEFVFGIDTSFSLIDIYVQRSREKNNDFKNRQFLDQFRNINIKDKSKIRHLGHDMNNAGIQAIITGLLKETTCFEEVVISGKK